MSATPTASSGGPPPSNRNPDPNSVLNPSSASASASASASYAIRSHRARPVPSAAAPAPNSSGPATSTAAAGPASTAPGSSNAAASSARILVSPRQKGNPILSMFRTVGWEFAAPSTPADYILGSNTCALFLSLRYHKLHPEYIFTRIRGLAPTLYRLRVLLVLVDVDRPDDLIRSLNHSCVLSGLSMILAWSAAEAARYLELYKTYEHSRPVGLVMRPGGGGPNSGARRVSAAIGTTAGALTREEENGTGTGLSYGAHVVEFVTAPRSINKTDAVGIVMAFGSIKGAVNAKPEELAQVAGWGQTKVRRWTAAVSEPFRRRTVTAADAIMKPDDEGEDGVDAEADAGGDGDDDSALGRENGPDNASIPADGDAEESVSTAPRSPPNHLLEGESARKQKRRRSSTTVTPSVPTTLSLEQTQAPAPSTASASASNSAPAPQPDPTPADLPTRRKPAKKAEELDAGIEAALAKLRGEG